MRVGRATSMLYEEVTMKLLPWNLALSGFPVVDGFEPMSEVLQLLQHHHVTSGDDGVDVWSTRGR